MGLSEHQADELVRLECLRYQEKNLRPDFSCIALYRDLATESPQHVVKVDAFYIDKYEVTHGEYRACVEAGECSRPANNYFYALEVYRDHPVNAISWRQADTYCRWLGKRLPTEAEWEKAARGTDGRLFPWGNEFDPTRANLCDMRCAQEWASATANDGFIATAPASGLYVRGISPYGAYNMVGNVWEWVSDWFAPDYYAISPAENPTGPDHGAELVVRGGGFYTSPGGSSATSRSHDWYSSSPRHNYTIGVRCAMDAPLSLLDPNPLPPFPEPERFPQPPGDGRVEGWAVLTAQEHYNELPLMEDQAAGFAYLDTLKVTLIEAGWAEDHIVVLRDQVTQESLTQAVRWLEEKADGDDQVFFYYSGNGDYLDLYLRWHAFFPPLWAQVAGQRILFVDACDGEYYARAVSGDGRGGLSIGSVRGGQCSWFGLPEDEIEILGPPFTHFFVEALQEARADLDGDGRISVQEAALYADVVRRAFVRETIFPVEALHRRYAAPWEDDPADDPAYPTLWMGDWEEEAVFLEFGR
jgi:formylglycine-generating enzyme required for sulfatase activity